MLTRWMMETSKCTLLLFGRSDQSLQIDSIFADVGRDYELEVVDKSTGERVKTDKVSTGPKTYFAKPILDSDDECDPGTRQTLLVAAGVSNPLNSANNDEDNMFADFAGEAGKNLSSSTAKTGADTMSVDAILKSSAAMLNELQGAGTAEKLITAEGIPSKPKKSGLSLSRLANNYGEEDPEFDQYYDSDDADEEEEAAADANQLDQGIKARKKTQLRRFDFDTEEEFQAYKDSQVVMPKTAYQFGVKNADGRKSRKELSGGGGRGGHDQEKKLDKEMKQLDKMMGVKYGISLTGASEGKKRGGNESGGSGSKKKRI
ncbi:RED-like protein C-terminal region-domain-containing protein [Chytriomyces sp. MP71]|nr:RED-like protein C-terminal region-domain-containing protein [Chytriomyces sp. MP71]